MKIKRSLLKDLSVGLKQAYIEILLGPRQVGKSTLMEDLASQLKQEKKVFSFLTWSFLPILCFLLNLKKSFLKFYLKKEI